jgi:hypothetical protein
MPGRALFEVPLVRCGVSWPLGDVVLPITWRAVTIVAVVVFGAVLAVVVM